MHIIIGLVGIILVINGCATYRPIPLTPARIEQRLEIPEMKEVRIQAKSIKHPLLRPIPFDDRDGLSPDEAAILAVIVNPSLRAIRDQRGLADAQLLKAGILPNPQLSYSFETPLNEKGQGKVNASGVGLAWEISSLISRGPRVEAARAHAASVELEVAWQEWQVAEAAKLHVLRLMIAREQFKVASRIEDTLHRSYEAIRHGVMLGVHTALDLSNAEAGLENARSVALQAQAEVERERLALNHSLGLPAGQVVKLEQNINIPFLKKIPSAKSLAEGVGERRLDLLAFKLGYKSQEARVRAAIESQFPRINIGPSGARDTDGLWTAGLGVSIDLPFFDRNQGRIAVERATRQQLFDHYVTRLFEARSDIARIIKELQSLQVQITNIDESFPEIKTLAKNYCKAADEGRAEVVGCYKIETRLYKKQLERNTLKRGIADLYIALEIASGRYLLSTTYTSHGSLN